MVNLKGTAPYFHLTMVESGSGAATNSARVVRSMELLVLVTVMVASFAGEFGATPCEVVNVVSLQVTLKSGLLPGSLAHAGGITTKYDCGGRGGGGVLFRPNMKSEGGPNRVAASFWPDTKV